jgi:regulator of cell morphogenesis and NO signaling
MNATLSQDLDAQQSVGAWVTADFRLAALFDRYGIDFCCGGDKPLSAACAEHGVNVDALVVEAQQVRAAPGMSERYDEWALDFLADYIVNQFHTYTKQALPQIADYATTVANVHGPAHPETIAIAKLWAEVQAELSVHLQREELLLFPAIKRLARSQEEGSAAQPSALGSAPELIANLEADHEATGSALAELARLSGAFTTPPDGCTTYLTLYALLREFDQNTRKHVHLENNILFPRTLRLQG